MITNLNAVLNPPEIITLSADNFVAIADNCPAGQRVSINDFKSPFSLTKHKDGLWYKEHTGHAIYPEIIVNPVVIVQGLGEVTLSTLAMPANFFTKLGFTVAFQLVAVAQSNYLTAGTTRTFRFYINDVLQTSSLYASGTTKISALSLPSVISLYNADVANNFYISTSGTVYTPVSIPISQAITLKLTYQTTNATDDMTILRSQIGF